MYGVFGLKKGAGERELRVTRDPGEISATKWQLHGAGERQVTVFGKVWLRPFGYGGVNGVTDSHHWLFCENTHPLNSSGYSVQGLQHFL